MVLYCQCDRQAIEVRRNENALVAEPPTLLSFLTVVQNTGLLEQQL